MKEKTLFFKIVSNEDDMSTKMANVDDIARLLACGSKEGYQSNLEFFEKWHNGEIPGNKYTIALYEDDSGLVSLVGILRLWQSPYCDDEWLLEGIEVHIERRRLGYGKKLMEKALEILSDLGVDSVYLNINQRNKISKSLALGLGFEEIERGCTNSFGHELKTSNHYVYKFKEIN